MTALSNLFSWIWLLFPGGPKVEPVSQVQPCSAPIENVCVQEQQQQSTQEKKGPFRHFWKNANRNGISNGI